MNNSLLLLLTK